MNQWRLEPVERLLIARDSVGLGFRSFFRFSLCAVMPVCTARQTRQPKETHDRWKVYELGRRA